MTRYVITDSRWNMISTDATVGSVLICAATIEDAISQALDFWSIRDLQADHMRFKIAELVPVVEATVVKVDGVSKIDFQQIRKEHP
jgi:hypothetical protein